MHFLRLLILLALTSSAVLGSDFPKGSPDFHTDFKKVAKLAESSGKPVVLIFSAAWCAPCQIMKKEVYPAESVKPFHDKFIWAYLDLDENAKLAATMGVSPIPDIRFLSAKGKELGSQVNMTSATDFAHTLEGILKKAAP